MECFKLKLIKTVNGMTTGRYYTAHESIDGYFVKDDYGDWSIVPKEAFEFISKENVSNYSNVSRLATVC